MNPATYASDVAEVSGGGYVLYDSSWPLPEALLRPDVTFLVTGADHAEPAGHVRLLPADAPLYQPDQVRARDQIFPRTRNEEFRTQKLNHQTPFTNVSALKCSPYQKGDWIELRVCLSIGLLTVWSMMSIIVQIPRQLLSN